jgi:hypothetical protein
VLCSIDTAYPDNEIDLVKALAILKVAAPKPNGANGKANSNPFELYGADEQWQRPDDYLALMDKIRSGESYHEPLVCLSARFVGSGMSDRSVTALLQDLMHASTGPRDERWQARYSGIERIVVTAREKFGRGPGSDAPSIVPDQGPPCLATPYVWVEPKTIPPRDWVYGRLLIRQFASVDIGTGSVGKSSHSIAEVLAMVSGRNLLGVQPEQRLRVWYWNLEDPRVEIERKIQACALHYGLTSEDIGDRLYVNHGRDTPLVIAKSDRNGAFIVRPVVDALIDQCKERLIDVIMVDPFVSSHRVEGNNNDDIDLVVKTWGEVADKGHCAVRLTHHTRKGEQEVTTESSRGAKALTDAGRIVRVFNRMTAEEGDKAGVENHKLYYRTYPDKVNLTPSPETSDWYQLRSVDLGNGILPGGIGGDSVGVVTAWEWPDPLAGITGRDFDKVAAVIRSGRWRENVRANDWAGKAVAKALDLDLSRKPDKAKAIRLLKAWLRAKSLRLVDEQDAHREWRTYVRVTEED